MDVLLVLLVVAGVLLVVMDLVRRPLAHRLVCAFTALVGLAALTFAGLVAANATEPDLDSSVWFYVGLSVLLTAIGLVLVASAWKGLRPRPNDNDETAGG